MTHEELLWAINSVVENAPCETVGHWSSAKALRAVVELHKPIMYESRVSNYFICTGCYEEEGQNYDYPCPTIKAIEEALK